VIDDAVRALADDPTVPMSTLRRRLDDPAALADPNVVKVVVTADGDALYFSRAPIPFGQEARAVPVWKHIGLYAYRRQALLDLTRLAPTPLERTEGLEQLRALEHGYRIRAVETTHDSIEVDTPQDLERARERLEAAERQRQPV
jgi:3-deoxy-manno-octulosonate cytidylyltransferase (CMP-KDO synthetase)